MEPFALAYVRQHLLLILILNGSDAFQYVAEFVHINSFLQLMHPLLVERVVVSYSQYFQIQLDRIFLGFEPVMLKHHRLQVGLQSRKVRGFLLLLLVSHLQEALVL